MYQYFNIHLKLFWRIIFLVCNSVQKKNLNDFKNNNKKMTLEFLNFILKVAKFSTLTLAYNNQNIYFSEINRNPSFHTVWLRTLETSKEFIKCCFRNLYYYDCCRYLVFFLNNYMELIKTALAWLFIYFYNYWNLALKVLNQLENW